MKEKWLRHSVLLSVTVSLLLGLAAAVVWYDPSEAIGTGLLLGIFFVYPLVLTLLNLFFLFAETRHALLLKKSRHFEWITLGVGTCYSMLLLSFSNITTEDWRTQLVNQELHTPIGSTGALTVFVLAAVGIGGYLILSEGSLRKRPPLVTVLAIAAMYLGMAECVLWIVQVFSLDWVMAYLCLLPANCILIGAKVIRRKVVEWRQVPSEEVPAFRHAWLEAINRKLTDSSRWPAAAFLLAWPLLGVLIGILLLFGQEPDRVIRAWTETSDWRLSAREAPPNLYQDQHYLCTVAAGGHRRLVKPLRKGVRHGHTVIVNRQLCIANAFEQVLEERMPRFHRCIRSFYDRYGFPLARCIRSPYAADVVYLLMKPLEWLFLLVLYAVDVKPENRIAVQYLPAETKGTSPSLRE